MDAHPYWVALLLLLAHAKNVSAQLRIINNGFISCSCDLNILHTKPCLCGVQASYTANWAHLQILILFFLSYILCQETRTTKKKLNIRHTEIKDKIMRRSKCMRQNETKRKEKHFTEIKALRNVCKYSVLDYKCLYQLVRIVHLLSSL